MAKIKEKNKKPTGLRKELIPHYIESGMFSKEVLGLTENDLQKIYAKAKHYYESGVYKEARGLFSFLCLIDKKTPSYLYSFASSAMMMDDLDVALEAFLNYAGTVQTDPLPYYYASLCYEKKKDLLSAIICLQTVVLRAGDQPQYQALKNRALLVINNFSEEKGNENNSKEDF